MWDVGKLSLGYGLLLNLETFDYSFGLCIGSLFSQKISSAILIHCYSLDKGGN